MPVVRPSPLQQDLSPAFRFLERRAVEKRYERLSAWVLSVLIHSLAIGSALALANGMTIRPDTSSFRWDVSIIQASRPSPVISEQQPVTQVAPTVSTQPPYIQSDRTRPRRQHALSRPPAPLASRIRTQSDVDVPVLPDVMDSPPKSTDSIEQTAPTGNEIISDQGADMAAAQEPLADAVPLSEPDSSEMPPPDVDAPEQSLMTQEPTVIEDKRILHRPSAIE